MNAIGDTAALASLCRLKKSYCSWAVQRTFPRPFARSAVHKSIFPVKLAHTRCDHIQTDGRTDGRTQTCCRHRHTNMHTHTDAALVLCFTATTCNSTAPLWNIPCAQISAHSIFDFCMGQRIILGKLDHPSSQNSSDQAGWDAAIDARWRRWCHTAPHAAIARCHLPSRILHFSNHSTIY